MGEAHLFGSEKGGVSKTTLSINIAISSAITQQSKNKTNETEIAFVDTDKQQSAQKWFERRNDKGIEPFIPCYHIMGKHLHKEIDELCKKYKRVIIDAGGRDSIEMRSSLMAKSLQAFWCPLQPSEFDLDTLERINDIVENAKLFNTNLNIVSVIFTMCSTHPKSIVANDARQLIMDNYSEHLTVCPITIGHRVAYQHSVTNSKSVLEYENDLLKLMPAYQAAKYTPKASRELSELYNYIFNEKFSGLDIVDRLHETVKKSENL